MEEQEMINLLREYAKKDQKLMVELKDGQKINCYPVCHNEADPDDWGFDFEIAPESEGIEWMHGTKIFGVPCSFIVNINVI